MAELLRKQLLDTSRGRIVTLLQAEPLTADDIATKMNLTQSAVRVQITAMERDGVVRRAGMRPGATRPSHVFELTPDEEQLLSKAYIPLLMQLVGACAEGLPAHQMVALLRRAGKGLARDLAQGKRLAGSLRSRVAMASHMMVSVAPFLMASLTTRRCSSRGTLLKPNTAADRTASAI